MIESDWFTRTDNTTMNHNDDKKKEKRREKKTHGNPTRKVRKSQLLIRNQHQHKNNQGKGQKRMTNVDKYAHAYATTLKQQSKHQPIITIKGKGKKGTFSIS